MKQNAKAIVEGIQEAAEDKYSFKEVAEFSLIPPENPNHYGTGYYMRVIVSDANGNLINKHYVDVRYEKTTDVEILADRWIKNWYGNNAKSVVRVYC